MHLHLHPNRSEIDLIRDKIKGSTKMLKESYGEQGWNVLLNHDEVHSARDTSRRDWSQDGPNHLSRASNSARSGRRWRHIDHLQAAFVQLILEGSQGCRPNYILSRADVDYRHR